MDEIRSEINSFKASDFTETAEVTDYVKITVKDYGEIVLRLRPDIAPKSVENFQKLVKEGHYSDKIFHRVIQNFMIQGGGFDTTGKQHEVASIKGEFSANGVENNLLHVRGVISMARTSISMDSASNQFFICDATKPHLDTQYAAFGYVLAGMDVVDAIAAVQTDGNDKPTADVVIEKVTFVEPTK
ncbi:MAG: peptidylprolyl isomerase [Ruminococcaceae bacterium]|nr:peptidylprolyl isomerase [Oscillospiraceae bacterium]